MTTATIEAEIECIMLDAIHMLLRNAAELGRTMTYGELIEAVKGCTHYNVGRSLTALAWRDKKAGTPPLSCLAVSSQTGYPSAGFWDKTMKEVYNRDIPKNRRYGVWNDLKGRCFGWYQARAHMRGQLV